MIAVANWDAPTTAVVLADGRVNPNIANQDGRTALMIAALCNYTIVLTLLLADERVDRNLADSSGDTALWVACRMRHVPVMKLLLADERVNPNVTNQHGITAVMDAVVSNNGTAVKVLLADERVNPNAADSQGNTLINLSACRRFVSVLELLLGDHRTIRTRPADEFGGDVYDAALFNVKYARRIRFKGLVRAVVAFRRMRLRAAQAVYAPGGAGFAAAAASFEALWALLENGEGGGGGSMASPEELIPAAATGDAATVASALRNPLTDPNLFVGPNSFTALMFAARFGHAPVVTLLLADERMNPNMTTRNGYTTFLIAVLTRHGAVVEVLLTDGRMDPNTADLYGRTPLLFAADNKDAPVVELLLADHRTIRTRPADEFGGDVYDAALFNVKYPRHARFKGLVRAVVAFRRMRLRAAQAVYAPGGAGFAAAAASFEAGQSARCPVVLSWMLKADEK